MIKTQKDKSRRKIQSRRLIQILPKPRNLNMHTKSKKDNAWLPVPFLREKLNPQEIPAVGTNENTFPNPVPDRDLDPDPSREIAIKLDKLITAV